MNSDLTFMSMEQELRALQKAFSTFKKYVGQPRTLIDVTEPMKTLDLTNEAIEILNKLIREGTILVKIRHRIVEPASTKRDSSFHGRIGNIRGNAKKLLREMKSMRTLISRLQSAALSFHGKEGQTIKLLNDLRDEANAYQDQLQEIKIVDSSAASEYRNPEGPGAATVVDAVWLLTSLTLALQVMWKKWKKNR